MQQPGQQPLRPIPVQGSSELQQLLDLVRLGNMHAGRSAFNSVPSAQPPYLPEFSLYNAAQLSGLLNNQHHNQHQAPQPDQLQQWGNLPGQANQAALSGSAQPALPESSTSRSSLPKGVVRGDKSSNAYATRHQAAEQRRRTRINDRLERLREVVPHSERANTATFLEEVIKYVEALKDRVTALETAQNLPLSCPPTSKEVLNGNNGCPTCSLTRMGGSETSSMGKPYVAPYPAAASQSTSFPPQLQPSSVLSSGELQAAYAPQVQKETPDTPPQSLVKEDAVGQAPGNYTSSAPEAVAAEEERLQEAYGPGDAKRSRLEAASN